MLLLFLKYVVILIPKGVKVGTEEQKTGKCVKLKKKKNQKKSQTWLLWLYKNIKESLSLLEWI